MERIVERYSFDRGYVESLRANDPAVQRHFATYFRELLLIKIRRRVPSADVADDLVQETFLRVLTTLRAGGLRSSPSLGAFVDSVCNNVLLEYYRSTNLLICPTDALRGPPLTDNAGTTPADRANRSNMINGWNDYIESTLTATDYDAFKRYKEKVNSGKKSISSGPVWRPGCGLRWCSCPRPGIMPAMPSATYGISPWKWPLWPRRA